LNILIIHPEGNIKNNPNLYAFAKELVSAGCKIVVFSLLQSGIYQGELFEDCKFQFYTLNKKENFKIKINLLKQGFNHIIGVDKGIIEASRFAKILGIGFSFLSYEIFFDKELSDHNNKTELKHKRQSKKACIDVKFAIVQDDVRRKLLSREYNVVIEKIKLMPVAGKGIRVIKKTDYFHQKLNIPLDNYILLYMGWMDEMQINRLTKYAAYIPDKWVIVIHSRYRYLGNLPKDFNTEKIFFSFDSPIDNIEDIGLLLSGVDAGFCTYKPTYETPYTGDNIKYVGLSSGKATTFLQYGIPIVVENMNIWPDLVREHQIGIEILTPHDFNYLGNLGTNEIINNCHKFFEEFLDMSIFFPQIIKDINLSVRKSKIKLFAFSHWVLSEVFQIMKSEVKRLFK
jgi:O-antigen biosynthesis protein